jgi:hypothetical protein
MRLGVKEKNRGEIMSNQITEDQIKNSPKRMQLAIIGAIIFGILQTSHFIIPYFNGQLTIGKAIGFSLMVLLLFISNSLSMISKSKFAYFALILFSIMALLGILAGSVHL